MQSGYLVNLGGNGQVDVGDSVAVSQTTFTPDQLIGTGSVGYSNGMFSGSNSVNYYRGTDGNIYASDTFFGGSPPPTSAQVNSFSAAPSSNGIVEGTFGDDLIDGSFVDSDGDQVTTGDDSIEAGEGRDTIIALAGDDTIAGNGGADSIDAGSGDDIVYAGGGDDYILSGAGDDTVYGGSGTDFIDATTVSAGNDTIYAGTGADTIQHDLATDLVYAGDGDDRVANVDTTGSASISTIYGGAGNDTYVLDANEGNFGSSHVVDLSAGRVTFAGGNRDILNEFENIELNENAAGAIGDANANTITAIGNFANSLDGGGGNDLIDSGQGDDQVYGGDGSDTLYSGAADDVVYGGAGADSISSGYSNDGTGDTVYGGAGDDIIDTFDTLMGSNSGVGDLVYGGLGNDQITGASGGFQGDSLFGGAGNDDIDALGGDDTVYGGDGDDRIYTGTGNDHLEGGAGSDELVGDGYRVNLGELNNGPTGAAADLTVNNLAEDAIEVWYYDSATDWTLGASIASGDSAVISTAVGEQWVVLDKNDFYLDVIEVTGTMTYDFGGEGLDDTLLGEAGNDDLWGYYGDDSLYGGSGDDLLEGGTGSDQLYGGQNDDTLYGDAGADTLVGGIGDDTIYGGDDQDTFVLSDGFGSDTIYGGEGGTDSDTLDLSALGSGVTVSFTGDERGTFTDGTDTATFFGIENVILTEQDDILDAQANGEALSVDARGGDDFVRSGRGNDTIDLGTGNDRVEGNLGADTYEGGDGDDTVSYFNSTDGVEVDLSDAGTESGGHAQGDVLTGFEQVDGSNAHGDTLIADALGRSFFGHGGDDTLYGGGGEDRLSGGAGDDRHFGGDGDDLIEGAQGNDLLDGGAGADDLRGDAGNDTLTGGAGNDVLTGGMGDDTFVLSSSGGDDTITDFGTGTVFVTGGDQLGTSALTDVGNALTNQDGTVTADEVTVTGGGGSDQVLTFPSGETVTVPDGTVDTTTQHTQFASLVAMGVPPCFAPGTHILTARGEVPVEQLRIGDMLITADHGPQPLRWMGRRHVDFRDPANTRADKDKPVEIKAGSLGHGLPHRPLIVSPLHRMVLSGPHVAEAFGEAEVLALAKALTGREHIRRMNGKDQVDYISLLLDRHEVIFAEGVPTESFRPGHVALASFQDHVKEQIYAIYPRLRAEPVDGLGPPARAIVGFHSTEELVTDVEASRSAGRCAVALVAPDAAARALEYANWDEDLADDRATMHDVMKRKETA